MELILKGLLHLKPIFSFVMFQYLLLNLFSVACFSTYSLSSQLEPSLSNVLPTKVNSIRGANRRRKERPPRASASPPDSKTVESLEVSEPETKMESSSDPDSGDERDFAAFLASARPAPPPRIKLEPSSETGTSNAATVSVSAAGTGEADGASSVAHERRGSQGSAAATAAPHVRQTDASTPLRMRRSGVFVCSITCRCHARLSFRRSVCFFRSFLRSRFAVHWRPVLCVFYDSFCPVIALISNVHCKMHFTVLYERR